MTLNGAPFSVISPNLVASWAHGVKVVEDVAVKKFTFAISSPDEFLVSTSIDQFTTSACSYKECRRQPDNGV